jgi:hypothetical protein
MRDGILPPVAIPASPGTGLLSTAQGTVDLLAPQADSGILQMKKHLFESLCGGCSQGAQSRWRTLDISK